jgi:hypothetical protein
MAKNQGTPPSDEAAKIGAKFIEDPRASGWTCGGDSDKEREK